MAKFVSRTTLEVPVLLLVLLCSVYAQKTFTDELWDNSEYIADAVVQTGFMQGIQNNALDPRKYGAYMVQDVKYLMAQRDNFLNLAYKELNKDRDLYEFFSKEAVKYTKYTSDAKKTWFIEDEYGIDAGEALQDYLNHYKDVAENKDSIYSAVAMLPCEHLWGWVADKLKPNSKPCNLYQFWIDENAGYVGGKGTADIINKYYQNGQINKEDAQDIYEESMRHELAFFQSQSTPNKDEL